MPVAGLIDSRGGTWYPYHGFGRSALSIALEVFAVVYRVAALVVEVG